MLHDELPELLEELDEDFLVSGLSSGFLEGLDEELLLPLLDEVPLLEDDEEESEELEDELSFRTVF